MRVTRTQGNTYTSYSDGGYRYSNTSSSGSTSSSYYQPSASSSSGSFCAQNPYCCTHFYRPRDSAALSDDAMCR